MNDADVVTAEEAFGGCPECGGSDGYVNVGRQQWGLCRVHRTKWQIGENLFSGWRDEAAEVWERNARELAGYRLVGSARPTAPAAATQAARVPSRPPQLPVWPVPAMPPAEPARS